MSRHTYDPKCWELACHFLADVPRATDDDRRQLARDLQQRAEDAISDIEFDAECIHCGEKLQTGPTGFTDCPACNPNPARE